MVELQLPGDQALLLEEDAGLYEAPLLAFLGGHCHSLALALHRRTTWPMVAIDRDRDGVRVHVAVQHDDGCIVDITGAHTPEEMSAAVEGGVSIVSVLESDLLALHRDHGWAAPVPDVVEPWVDVALAQCDGEPLEPMTTPVLGCKFPQDDGMEIMVTCNGEPYLVVKVRQGRGPWVGYADVRLPNDDDGICRMPFHTDWFVFLATRYVEDQFDADRARSKLAQGG